VIRVVARCGTLEVVEGQITRRADDPLEVAAVRNTPLYGN